VRAGAPAFLRTAARREERWDLVLCDPPYRLAHRLARDLDELLTGVLDPEGRIVCESSVKMPLRLELPLVTERRYGDTLITVHRHASPRKTR
jgi:16S rRNA (guanine966-N2)-methyltransferase